MFNYILRFADTVRARIAPTGCSITHALQVELPKLDRDIVFKLRDSADDLRRILDLELARRDGVELADDELAADDVDEGDPLDEDDDPSVPPMEHVSGLDAARRAGD